MPGPSPTPDLMDPLALFTHGEFLCWDSDDPELLLYTHGEFPRPSAVVVVDPEPPTFVPSRGGGEDDDWSQYQVPELTPEEIAMVLLLLDEC